jgi:hypothetical protein
VIQRRAPWRPIGPWRRSLTHCTLGHGDSASQARIRWAVLLTRIYEVLPILCPACGGLMSILAILTDPPVVSAILVHLDLPNKPARRPCPRP